MLLRRWLYLTFNCIIFTAVANAQNKDSSDVIQEKLSTKNLFENDEVLNIRLTGNIRELMNDRVENPQYHSLILSYKSEDGIQDSLYIEAKTRGHFRKTMGNCTYPPLLLHFSHSDSLASSIFHDQYKLKLVMPCQGDEYVIREWLAYKIYNLITPVSFKARLVTIELNDTKKKKITPA